MQASPPLSPGATEADFAENPDDRKRVRLSGVLEPPAAPLTPSPASHRPPKSALRRRCYVLNSVSIVSTRTFDPSAEPATSTQAMQPGEEGIKKKKKRKKGSRKPFAQYLVEVELVEQRERARTRSRLSGDLGVLGDVSAVAASPGADDLSATAATAGKLESDGAGAGAGAGAGVGAGAGAGAGAGTSSSNAEAAAAAAQATVT